MESERSWYPHENGMTIGRRGPAGGRVQRDEEFGDSEEPEEADARITLETTSSGGFTVTANLYGGWLQETATFAEEAVAAAAFDTAKAELSHLADLIPDEEARDLTVQVERLNREVTVFTARFGGSPTV